MKNARFFCVMNCTYGCCAIIINACAIVALGTDFTAGSTTATTTAAATAAAVTSATGGVIAAT